MTGFKSFVIFIIVTLDLFAPGTTVGSVSNQEPVIKTVEMVDVLYYHDGGTTGFVAKVNGEEERFCMDGRMSVAPAKRHLFLGATHPSSSGATQVPIGGQEESRVLRILDTWLNAHLNLKDQETMAAGVASKDSLEKTKMWWTIRVREQLKDRRDKFNKRSAQPGGPADANNGRR